MLISLRLELISLTRDRCPLTRERGGTSWLGVSWGMVKREGVTSWVGGYVEGGTLGGGGGGVRWWGVCWMLDTLRGYVGGREYVGGGGGGKLGRGGVVDVKSCLGGLEKPLKSCLKNRSKITARNERFLSGLLSKI